MPKYLPFSPLTDSFLELNFRPRYMKDEHDEHWIEKGSIIRTGIRSSLPFFLPRGTSFGSKSAGMYLLRTLRSPWIGTNNKECKEERERESRERGDETGSCWGVAGCGTERTNGAWFQKTHHISHYGFKILIAGRQARDTSTSRRVRAVGCTGSTSVAAVPIAGNWAGGAGAWDDGPYVAYVFVRTCRPAGRRHVLSASFSILHPCLHMPALSPFHRILACGGPSLYLSMEPRAELDGAAGRPWS